MKKIKNYTNKLSFLILVILFPFFIQAQPIQKFALLGDFKLENGQVIKNCKVGYLTCGRLNSGQTNAILMFTYFGGVSKDLLFLTGKGMIADSSKYFVVVIDALGDGVSSSPSNSESQHNKSFPVFNIRDMVKSEYILASKVLGLKHAYCVMGSSMGGMQAFQWIVSYPDFMDKAVIEVGSPKLTSNDLLLWNSELLAINEGLNCNATEESIKNTVVAIHILNLQTPDYLVEHISSDNFPKFLEDAENQYTKIFNSYNWPSQLRAMIAQNVAYPFNNDMIKAAGVVRAKVLIIVSKQDHMVNPHPAMDFAKLINAKIIELDNNCGHLGVGCEMRKINIVIIKFLRD
jgi:homoserine O-acetyltransferase